MFDEWDLSDHLKLIMDEDRFDKDFLKVLMFSVQRSPLIHPDKAESAVSEP